MKTEVVKLFLFNQIVEKKKILHKLYFIKTITKIKINELFFKIREIEKGGEKK